MPTDDELREVARRLRGISPCKSGHIMWWKIAQALGLKQPAGWFGWEKFEPDSANRLADLIEPSCDRDALLALADELDEDACWEVQTPGDASGAWRLKDICDRIREALGVTDG